MEFTAPSGVGKALDLAAGKRSIEFLDHTRSTEFDDGQVLATCAEADIEVELDSDTSANQRVRPGHPLGRERFRRTAALRMILLRGDTRPDVEEG